MCVRCSICEVFHGFRSNTSERNWCPKCLWVKYRSAQVWRQQNVTIETKLRAACVCVCVNFSLFSFILFLTVRIPFTFPLLILRVQKCDPILVIIFSLIQKTCSEYSSNQAAIDANIFLSSFSFPFSVRNVHLLRNPTLNNFSFAGQTTARLPFFRIEISCS